jgi:hypothetical protein
MVLQRYSARFCLFLCVVLCSSFLLAPGESGSTVGLGANDLKAMVKDLSTSIKAQAKYNSVAAESYRSTAEQVQSSQGKKLESLMLEVKNVCNEVSSARKDESKRHEAEAARRLDPNYKAQEIQANEEAQKIVFAAGEGERQRELLERRKEQAVQSLLLEEKEARGCESYCYDSVTREEGSERRLLQQTEDLENPKKRKERLKERLLENQARERLSCSRNAMTGRSSIECKEERDWDELLEDHSNALDARKVQQREDHVAFMRNSARQSGELAAVKRNLSHEKELLDLQQGLEAHKNIVSARALADSELLLQGELSGKRAQLEKEKQAEALLVQREALVHKESLAKASRAADLASAGKDAEAQKEKDRIRTDAAAEEARNKVRVEGAAEQEKSKQEGLAQGAKAGALYDLLIGNTLGSCKDKVRGIFNSDFKPERRDGGQLGLKMTAVVPMICTLVIAAPLAIYRGSKMLLDKYEKNFKEPEILSKLNRSSSKRVCELQDLYDAKGIEVLTDRLMEGFQGTELFVGSLKDILIELGLSILKGQPYGELLLAGPPGTGKTLFAGIISDLFAVLGKDSRQVRMEEISHCTNPEGMAKDVVAYVEKKQAMLFFDEADKLILKRRDDPNLTPADRKIHGIFMENTGGQVNPNRFSGTVVFCTNVLQGIDGAMRSRFGSRLIEFPEPDKKVLCDLISHHMKRMLVSNKCQIEDGCLDQDHIESLASVMLENRVSGRVVEKFANRTLNAAIRTGVVTKSVVDQRFVELIASLRANQSFL